MPIRSERLAAEAAALAADAPELSKPTDTEIEPPARKPSPGFGLDG